MRVLLALIALPFIEIALFILVGGEIGLWPTLALVALTTLLGVMTLRGQGPGALGNLRGTMSGALAGRQDPVGPVFDRAMVFLAGGLLVLPGFLTDAVGLLLLVPPVRAAIEAAIRRRFTVLSTATHATYRQGDVIDAEFRRLDPDDPDQRH